MTSFVQHPLRIPPYALDARSNDSESDGPPTPTDAQHFGSYWPHPAVQPVSVYEQNALLSEDYLRTLYGFDACYTVTHASYASHEYAPALVQVPASYALPAAWAQASPSRQPVELPSAPPAVYDNHFPPLHAPVAKPTAQAVLAWTPPTPEKRPPPPPVPCAAAAPPPLAAPALAATLPYIPACAPYPACAPHWHDGDSGLVAAHAPGLAPSVPHVANPAATWAQAFGTDTLAVGAGAIAQPHAPVHTSALTHTAPPAPPRTPPSGFRAPAASPRWSPHAYVSSTPLEPVTPQRKRKRSADAEADEFIGSAPDDGFGLAVAGWPAEKRIKYTLASEVRRQKLAAYVGFLPTDPETMSLQNKKRCYVECMEQYVEYLHQQLRLVGHEPVPLRQVKAYKGVNSRSIRTMAVYMQTSVRKAHAKVIGGERTFLHMSKQLSRRTDAD